MSLPHQQFAAERVMIMAAPNGARRTQDDHPALPLSNDEIARCAAAIADAGAAVLHLHVRDDQGGHTLDVARYRDAIEKIRREVGDRLVIQVTSEAVGRYSAEEQMAMVRELRPEAVSLALAEVCPDDAAVPAATKFFAWLKKEQVWPQYILYSADDLQRFDALRHRGAFVEERPNVLFVLGRYATDRQGDPAELDELLAAADCEMFPWTACCFGDREHDAMCKALAAGGHVRIGFENNLKLADGSKASDNAALVRQFVEAAADAPRSPATADEVRESLFSYRA